jgi:plasmid stabilization system protein ParE
MRVRYSPQAQTDLDEIFDYLDSRSPAGARSVKKKIVAGIDRLVDHPFMAPATDEPDVFELTIIRFPYKVYYQVENDEVWIVHIRHASRRPWQGE